jgi:transcription antitermination factor NusG
MSVVPNVCVDIDTNPFVMLPPVDVAGPWFALQVRPRHEKKVSDSLRELGHPVFLPQYLSRHRWSDRTKEIALPLFPGYTFCQTMTADHWRVLQVPGVTAIVGFGKTPAPLDEQEMAAIRSITDSGMPVSPWPALHRGDRVYLTGGPLRGLRGLLVSVGGSHRIVVSVALLQRAVAVEIQREWVVPEGPKGPASELLFHQDQLQRFPSPLRGTGATIRNCK